MLSYRILLDETPYLGPIELHIRASGHDDTALPAVIRSDESRRGQRRRVARLLPQLPGTPDILPVIAPVVVEPVAPGTAPPSVPAAVAASPGFCEAKLSVLVARACEASGLSRTTWVEQKRRCTRCKPCAQ